MLSAYGPSTIVAIAIGVLVSLGAFIPLAARRYRRTGRLRPGEVVMLVAVATYGAALWAYTMVPLPETRDYHCTGHNLVPFAFVHDILSTLHDGSLLTNRALVQAVFNVCLFVPFGAFLRWLFSRGVILTTLAGFALSTLIELTQLTGLWGIFPCSYRTFDVDDIMLNTAGALIGSLLAIPFAARLAHRQVGPPPTTVTLGRRAVGVVVDVGTIALLNYALVVVWQAVRLYGFGIAPGQDEDLGRALLAWLPALVVEGLCVLMAGRTCGEIVVGIRPAEPAGGRRIGRRLVKFVAGTGGYAALVALPWVFPLWVFVTASVIAIVMTKDRRGLTGLLTRLPLEPAPLPATDAG